MQKVLVVDEDPVFREFIIKNLREKGIQVATAENGTQALALAKSEPLDLIIANAELPDLDHPTFLQRMRDILPPETTLLFTSETKGNQHVAKPISSDLLEEMLTRARKKHTSHEKQVIASSMTMQEILKEAAKIAKSNASVLITGESGTGKEVIAQVIHSNSQRHHKPFVKVNCAAIPENLVESEFFGHEKGSFTGANGQKLGRFEIAHNGTLLLDEVTEIPLGLQAKLLRAIQEQEFERVGGTKSIKVNVRILATSNRDPLQAVEQKVLREDLYYRLNVVPIHLPPLREHPEDIVPLAEHFLKQACLANQIGEKKLSDGALEQLLHYPWPGNVRELANMMERMAVLVEEPCILQKHLPLSETDSNSLTLDELEKKHILGRLKGCSNDLEETAKSLGISPRKLQNKLKEYGLESP